MAEIVAVEQTLHRLTLDPPYPAAWDRRPRHAFPVAVVRVTDVDGRQGVAVGDACRGLADYVHLFVGTDALDLDRHAEVLANVDFFDGRPWVLDLALWDLAGRTRDEPLWRMVGGRGSTLRPYASSGSHWPLAEVADRVGHLLDRGFGALKLRFGRASVDDDFAVFERVRDVAGDRLELMVDCNQGWRMPWDTHPAWTFDDALPVARRLADLGVAWMEEPLHRADVDGMAALRDAVDVPIAGAEMTRNAFLLDALVERRALDVVQTDVAVSLGVAAMVRLAHRVAEAGLVFSPHTWGCGPVLVANAHVAAGTVGAPWLEYPYDPPLWDETRRDFPMVVPWTPAEDDLLHLGDAPGLGITLDEERLAATRTDVATYA